MHLRTTPPTRPRARAEKYPFVLSNHNASRLSSYWVVQVPDELLPDHNEFFRTTSTP